MLEANESTRQVLNNYISQSQKSFGCLELVMWLQTPLKWLFHLNSGEKPCSEERLPVDFRAGKKNQKSHHTSDTSHMLKTMHNVSVYRHRNISFSIMRVADLSEYELLTPLMNWNVSLKRTNNQLRTILHFVSKITIFL